jgi:hypothetical protein
LSPVAPDKFVAEYPIGALQFSRGKSGRCDGFTINDGRVQKLRFDKVAISPLQMEQALVGFQGRELAEVVPPHGCHSFLLEALIFQWP